LPSAVGLVAHYPDLVAEMMFEHDQRRLDRDVVWQPLRFAEGKCFRFASAIELYAMNFEGLAPSTLNSIEHYGVREKNWLPATFEPRKRNFGAIKDQPNIFHCGRELVWGQFGWS
jgi:hypothetical protein